MKLRAISCELHSKPWLAHGFLLLFRPLVVPSTGRRGGAACDAAAARGRRAQGCTLKEHRHPRGRVGTDAGPLVAAAA
eukprot:5163094-Pleurochrysis_carterae.AAC.1